MFVISVYSLCYLLFFCTIFWSFLLNAGKDLLINICLYQQMHVTTGRYHTLLISNSSVYSCGSSLCGVLGQGPEAKQCVTFTRISFPSPAHVIQVSASHNHAAFVMQSGEVSTCSYLITALSYFEVSTE